MGTEMLNEFEMRVLLRKGDYLRALGVQPSAGNAEILMAIVRAKNAYPSLHPLLLRAQNALVSGRERYERVHAIVDRVESELVGRHGEALLVLLQDRDETVFELLETSGVTQVDQAVQRIRSSVVERLPGVAVLGTQISAGRAECIAVGPDGKQEDVVFQLPPGVQSGWVIRGRRSGGADAFARITGVQSPGGQAIPLGTSSLSFEQLFALMAERDASAGAGLSRLGHATGGRLRSRSGQAVACCLGGIAGALIGVIIAGALHADPGAAFLSTLFFGWLGFAWTRDSVRKRF